ncbi:MAG TPA: hypothetical protein VFH17_07140 [Coriobacteriia bacterium]|nr:hypothetical protein [Coriobacteriia bacterium]
MSDLQHLTPDERELARLASEVKAARNAYSHFASITHNAPSPLPIDSDEVKWRLGAAVEASEAKARFNAACDSATVLALLARLSALRGALAELRGCALSGDEARLLMVGVASTRVSPELHARCDRIAAADAKARAALKASRE